MCIHIYCFNSTASVTPCMVTYMAMTMASMALCPLTFALNLRPCEKASSLCRGTLVSYRSSTLL